jgi:hypothetical protein
MRKPNKNTAYKCAKEAHEFYKTMNHYHKRAMLANLLDEVGFIVTCDKEEYMVQLKMEDLVSDEHAWETGKPYEVYLTTRGQELICHKGRFQKPPKLGLVGQRIMGRPRKVRA